MHHLYYVAVRKTDDTTSEDIRNKAYNALENNSFANSEGGYWSAGKSDWFVIGGRWSGELQRLTIPDWAEKARKVMKKTKKKDDWVTTSDIEKHTKELQKLWEGLGGKGNHPYNRDQYNNNGFEDDAQLLTKELYTALKARYKTKPKKGDIWGETEVAVLEDEYYVVDEMPMREFLKRKDIIGNYYLVVVDYHN